MLGVILWKSFPRIKMYQKHIQNNTKWNHSLELVKWKEKAGKLLLPQPNPSAIYLKSVSQGARQAAPCALERQGARGKGPAPEGPLPGPCSLAWRSPPKLNRFPSMRKIFSESISLKELLVTNQREGLSWDLCNRSTPK